MLSALQDAAVYSLDFLNRGQSDNVPSKMMIRELLYQLNKRIQAVHLLVADHLSVEVGIMGQGVADLALVAAYVGADDAKALELLAKGTDALSEWFASKTQLSRSDLAPNFPCDLAAARTQLTEMGAAPGQGGRGSSPMTLGGLEAQKAWIAGRPKATTAGRLCKCSRCKVDIHKGDKCFDVPQPLKQFSSPRRLCEACLRLVLAKTKEDLAQLEGL
jgi:hypothetical protein